MPQDRVIDWSEAGLPGGIPTRTTIFCDVTRAPYGARGDDAFDNRAAFQAAFDACPSGQVVYIPPGVYRVNGSLVVPSNITIRGAGVGQTIVKSVGTGAGLFMFGGTSTMRWDPSSITTNIVSGATKGSTQLGVLSTTGMTVGSYLVITEANDPAYVTIAASQEAATWVDGWNTAGQRARGQIVEIKGINGTNVTISPALYSDYRLSPWATRFTAACKNSGVEDLSTYATNSGTQRNFFFQTAAYCWVSNVYSDFTDGDHVTLDWSYRCEVRHSHFYDAFIHGSGQWDNMIGLRQKSSACLIVDNIVERLHTGVMCEWGAAGNVIAYNYIFGEYDSSVTNGARWLPPSISANHGAHPQFNLFEGNVLQKFTADSYWGSSSHAVVLRNWITGEGVTRPPYNARGPAGQTVTLGQDNRTVDLWTVQTKYSVLGNVLGSPSFVPAIYKAIDPAPRAYDGKYIWSLGYAGSGDTGGLARLENPALSVIDHGNYDSVTSAVRWDTRIADRTIPASLFLPGKPAWFGNLAWPAFDPANPNPSTDRIPASYRRVHGVDPAPMVTTAPIVTGHPQNQTVVAGAGTSFTVSASGSPAPAYQWLKNGVVLAGANAPTLTLANVQSADAGNYSAVVSNSAGSATSNTAVLTVGTTPIAAVPEITRHPGSETLTAGSSVTFSGEATGTPSPSYQWRKNGVNIPGATSPTLTFSSVQASDGGNYNLIASNSAGTAFSNTANLTVTSAPIFTLQPLSQNIVVGGAVGLQVAATGAPLPTYQWRKNGVAIPGATGAMLELANATLDAAGTYTVTATNYIGSATSNPATITVSASAVSAPAIVTQPGSETVTAGSNVLFAVVASGSPSPTYQWRKNGIDIAGATQSTLSLANVQLSNAGNYNVLVRNSAGQTTSNSANLTVVSAPTFTTQPTSQTVTAGTGVTFVAVATGAPAPRYQWRKNGVDLSGATGSSYTIGSAALDSAGTYTLVASNYVGSVMSTGALLTVNPAKAAAPTITQQPEAQTVVVGTRVTFTAAATGSPTPTYQWRKNNKKIAGATSSTLVLTEVEANDGGNYYFVATNSLGSVTSNAANLTIVSPPIITLQPTPVSVLAGASVTFQAKATAAPSPSYQWRKNGIDIPGATNASYAISTVTAAAQGAYSVRVSNYVGSVLSSPATLTVNSTLLSADFNGDAKSDIAWENSLTGERRVWLMSGTTLNATSSLPSATGWELNGTGDFNADGKSDLICSNQLTGSQEIWLIAGASLTSRVPIGTMGLAWRIAAAADFNGDGQTDLVLEERLTGKRQIWLMNGTALSGTVPLPTTALDWKIAGAGDFNRDGRPDILVENTVTGERRTWLMAGTAVADETYLATVEQGWRIGGTGDFNADGQSDIVWQNTITGQREIWLMNGTTLVSIVPLGFETVAWSMRN